MSQRKPLFSRNQLNLIILVSTLLITILAWPPNQPPQPELLQINGIPLYRQPLTDQQPQDPRLHLIFSLEGDQPFPPWQARLLTSVIEQRLQQTESLPPVRIELHHDRLSLQFQASQAAPLSGQIQQLAGRLLQPLTPAELELQTQRLRAQRYLQRRQSQALTGQPFGDFNEINISHDPGDIQQPLLSRNRLHLVLAGTLETPLVQALENFIAQLPESTEWTLSSPVANTAQSYPHSRLLPLPGRSSSAYPQSLILGRSFSALPAGGKVEFYSGSNHSWLVWQAQQQPLPQQLEIMRRQLEQLTDPQWQQLLDDFRQLLVQPHTTIIQQARQLEVIARYRLQLDYRQQLAATIADLTPEQMKLFIDQQFSADRLTVPVPPESANQENHGQKP